MAGAGRLGCLHLCGRGAQVPFMLENTEFDAF